MTGGLKRAWNQGRAEGRPGLPGLIDPQASLFAAYSTGAALIALVAATWLGISHPYWAAMTVWLVAQPTRDLLLERCAARLAGTAVGAAAGWLLLLNFGDQAWALMIGVAAWLSLCIASAMAFRYFKTYGLLLAGYTACIVAMAGWTDPIHQDALAFGRLACTAIGVLSSTLVSGIFLKPSQRDPLRLALQRFARTVLEQAADDVDATPRANRADGQILTEIGVIGGLADQAGAGSLRWANRARWARHVLAAGLTVAAEARRAGWRGPSRTATSTALREQADNLDRAVRCAPAEGGRTTSPDRRIDVARRDLLRGLVAFDRSVASRRHSLWGLEAIAWRDVLQAAGRAVLALAVVAGVWLATDWNHGPAMVMSAAIFVTLFSAHDNAQAATAQALRGCVVGAGCGLIYCLWLQPGLHGDLALIAGVTPFLALGAYAMARPATAKAAIDYNMCFLLVAQPLANMGTTASDSVAQALAIVLGVMAAMLAFLLIAPATPAARLRLLHRTVLDDLGAVLRSDEPATARRRYIRLTVRCAQLAALGSRTRIGAPGDLVDLLAAASAAVAHVERTGSPSLAAPPLFQTGEDWKVWTDALENAA
ncbi:MAG: FUSC family protein [Brevundimonas sp.]|uniref:FUSC family protein n=1 Tax=Brevundimonas sp. TaxID=1871086 RepID=UPI002719DD84|nr:FUSC family protein [Brevundimonas sp.]MDO9607849.1 FUSC family protein [Brevundimonas sp.]